MIIKSIKELIELSPCEGTGFVLAVGCLLALIYLIRHIGLIHMMLRDNNEYGHDNYKKAFFLSSILTTMTTFTIYYIFVEICLWQIDHSAIIILCSILYMIIMLIMGIAMWVKYDDKRFPEGLFNVTDTIENYLNSINKFKRLKKELYNTLNQQIS